LRDKALRFNKGKLELSQCPEELVAAVAAVLMRNSEHFGGKYPRANWTKGAAYSQLIDCLERHLAAFKSGVDLDTGATGDGMPHLWHLATNVAFLIFNSVHHPENDDRNKKYPFDPDIFTSFLKTDVSIPCDGNPEFTINKKGECK